MQYRFGIIFDFYPHLKKYDTTKIFAYVDHEILLSYLINFIRLPPVGNDRTDIESLLDDLIREGIIQYHVVFKKEEAYVDLSQLLFNLCDSLFSYLKDIPAFFYSESSYQRQRPSIKQINHDTFLIMIGYIS